MLVMLAELVGWLHMPVGLYLQGILGNDIFYSKKLVLKLTLRQKHVRINRTQRRKPLMGDAGTANFKLMLILNQYFSHSGARVGGHHCVRKDRWKANSYFFFCKRRK